MFTKNVRHMRDMPKTFDTALNITLLLFPNFTRNLIGISFTFSFRIKSVFVRQEHNLEDKSEVSIIRG